MNEYISSYLPIRPHVGMEFLRKKMQIPLFFASSLIFLCKLASTIMVRFTSYYVIKEFYSWDLKVALLVISECLGDVSHLLHNYHVETTTLPPPPVPYSFHYKAGRFPGNVDRFRSESGDGSGRIQGTYSYIDPKFQIRTVDYTADQHGFHPVLKNFEEFQAQPVDSEAVQREKARHYALYQRIAERNSHGPSFSAAPRETVSVAKAKERHLELFQKIAAEHQAIAAERESERLAYEATSVPNDVNNHHY